MSKIDDDDDFQYNECAVVKSKLSIDVSETFGQYKVRKYTDSSNGYHVTLHFNDVALEHLEIEDANEAGNEYNLIRHIVKHAAGQIEMAKNGGPVGFGGSGFGSSGSAPQML